MIHAYLCKAWKEVHGRKCRAHLIAHFAEVVAQGVEHAVQDQAQE